MISLDQVLLLEKKVESAVARIAQLNAENAALRSKCIELTNALSAKTEQFSNFQSDQSRIEEGILKALNRLNSVENAILSGSDTATVAQAAPVAAVSVQNTSVTTSASVQPTVTEQNVVESSISDSNDEIVESEISIPVSQENIEPPKNQETSSNQPLFDIF